MDDGARTYVFSLITLSVPGVVAATLLALVGRPYYVGRFTFGLSIAGLFYLILLGAFHIETMGIRFFGRNHRWRIDGAVAYTICAHAAPGWLVGGLAYALAFPLWLNMEYATTLLLPAGLVGLLSFETFVYIGMRRMRFANRPEARLMPDDSKTHEPTQAGSPE